MKRILIISLLFPLYTRAQTTDNIYNKVFFFRPFEVVSYSEIKKFNIKCIKYTFSKLNQVAEKDSNGKLVRKRNLITEHAYESFDSLGMMIGVNSKSCINSDIVKDNPPYTDETLNLLKNLNRKLKQNTDFRFHDTNTKSIIFYKKSSKTIVLKNYSDWHSNDVTYKYFLNDKHEFTQPKFDIEPWTFFLNDKGELKKDSIHIHGVLGCEEMNIVSNYKYNSRGKIIEKTSSDNRFIEKRKYNTLGNLSEISVNGKLYAKYYYENEKLIKIVFESKIGLNLVEIEY